MRGGLELMGFKGMRHPPKKNPRYLICDSIGQKIGGKNKFREKNEEDLEMDSESKKYSASYTNPGHIQFLPHSPPPPGPLIQRRGARTNCDKGGRLKHNGV